MDIQHRTLTLEEYQAICDLPENADKILELIDGEVVEKMPSYEPSNIAGWIVTYINMYLLQHPIGSTTTSDGGYVLSADRVLIPDVGYISNEHRGEKPQREVLAPPDLAVEVKSPTDSKRAMRRKAEKYLENGTRLVWLVFPEEREIEVYNLADEDVQTIGIDGTLDGGNILPEFTLPVANIFRD